MGQTGRCYCDSLKYEIDSEAVFSMQCHCRECQYFSGGAPNVVFGVPSTAFRYTKGKPELYCREDLETPVVREFCGKCGTHILSRPPGLGMDIVKVGTLDDPSQYQGPQMAIYMCDAQSFHSVPEGVPTFEKAPG